MLMRLAGERRQTTRSNDAAGLIYVSDVSRSRDLSPAVNHSDAIGASLTSGVSVGEASELCCNASEMLRSCCRRFTVHRAYRLSPGHPEDQINERIRKVVVLLAPEAE